MTHIKGSFPITSAIANLTARIVRKTPSGGCWFKVIVDDGNESKELGKTRYAKSPSDVHAACRAALN